MHNDIFCISVVNAITSSDVPLDVKTDVKNRLIEVFGDDVEEILLAVRSSAIGLPHFFYHLSVD